MKNIEKIDKKLAVAQEFNEELKYYDIPHENFDLYGVFYDKEYGFLRMPKDAAQRVSDGVGQLTEETSGGRIRFSTDSTVVSIKVEYDGFWPIPHMALNASAGFVLLEERQRNKKYVRILTPNFQSKNGFTASTAIEMTKKMRNYILYFPLYHPVKSLSIGLENNACLKNGKRYKEIEPIVYYGASITQGACASRPDNCYQARIEKWNNINYINLGFSGNGKGEDEMVDYLIDLPCSLFVCDFNFSGLGIETLKERHMRLYNRYRKANPSTPILFLSRTDDQDYADRFDRENAIYETYKYSQEQGDNNTYFLSMLNVFDGKDKTSFTVDGDHPTDLGFYLMAKRIYKKMIEIDKRFN